MRVLVCGGRDYKDWDRMFEILDLMHKNVEFTCLIEGNAVGADQLAGQWARDRKIKDHEVYPADWKTHGLAAGPVRNRLMLKEGRPDLVVAFPGGRGTAHMIGIARDAGVNVIEIEESDDRTDP